MHLRHRVHWKRYGFILCRDERTVRWSTDLYDVTCLRCLRRAVRRAGEDPTWAL